jgi:hypothetical protein
MEFAPLPDIIKDDPTEFQPLPRGFVFPPGKTEIAAKEYRKHGEDDVCAKGTPRRHTKTMDFYYKLHQNISKTKENSAGAHFEATWLETITSRPK